LLLCFLSIKFIEKLNLCYVFLATNEIKTNPTIKYPTVWLGSGDGWLYIHSAINECSKTIEKIWLRHAIYSIV
jgi:hypothetical protein